MSEALTTELEAVNAMLSAVGDSPVNTLTGNLPAGLQAAVDLLRETSRQVQLLGWHFNTEDYYTLSRNGSGYITLASNILDIDLTVEDGSIDVVQRGNRLYDKKNHTYVFTSNLECSITWFLPWTQLPEAVRHYIKVKAARIYQDQTLGSESHHRYTAQNEMEALAAIKASDAESQDATIFDTFDMYSIVARKRPMIIHQ